MIWINISKKKYDVFYPFLAFQAKVFYSTSVLIGFTTLLCTFNDVNKFLKFGMAMTCGFLTLFLVVADTIGYFTAKPKTPDTHVVSFWLAVGKEKNDYLTCGDSMFYAYTFAWIVPFWYFAILWFFHRNEFTEIRNKLL